MMPIKFPKANTVFVLDGCFDLPAYRDNATGETITFWQFNKEELDKIIAKAAKGEAIGVWLSVTGPIFPTSLTFENPFILPREMRIGDGLVNNAYVSWHYDEELVFITIKPGEKNFEVVKMVGGDGSDVYVLYCELEGYAGKQMTDYVFGEEVKVLNMETYFNGEHDYLLKHCKKKPETTLVLERVNKTPREI